MMWAACCMVFFGFLRSNEFTVPSPGQFDHSIDSSRYFTRQPTVTSNGPEITIKQSKTDPFRQGVTLSLGRTDHEICPVQAIVSYLAAQGSRTGPLFLDQNNTMLTREGFSLALDKLLSQLHLDKGQFNMHSFRIGAENLAKQAGMSNLHIKTLGRWRSDVY